MTTQQDFIHLSPDMVASAHQRIKSHIHRTPIITSSVLNEWLGHDIYFKCENLQKIGAFKARGAINKLLSLNESGNLPTEIVAYSSGNHAQAVAWAVKELIATQITKNITVTIFIPNNASALKIQATKALGANVIITENRAEAEYKAQEKCNNGAYLIPPYDDDDILLGQGTACYEAIQDMPHTPNTIFIPVGGGGLFAGSILAQQLLAPYAKIYGAEPKMANDAAISLRQNDIYRLTESPNTLADGVRTLSLSPRTFYYARQSHGIFEISEDDICYWHQWLSHLLKTHLEPTSALSMVAVYDWLKQQKPSQKQHIMVMLCGGNASAQTMQKIWQTDYLNDIPHL